jgi:hypothetical protein
MATPAGPLKPSETEPRWAPAHPIAALAPGVVLLFAGLWMVTDGGPLPLGWACFAAGLAFLIVGAVAQGVMWALDFHAFHRR